MKRLTIVIALTTVLSISVSAGEIPTGGIAVPHPPPDGVQAAQAPGNIPTDGLTYEITDTALDLIQVLISIGI